MIEKYFFYSSEAEGCAVSIGGKGERIAVSQKVFDVLRHTQWAEKQTAQRHQHIALDEANINSQLRIHASNPESCLIQKERDNKIHDVLVKNCSQKELELLLEIVLNGRTVTDYAQELGVPRSTLESRKCALYKKLRKLLKEFRFDL